MTRTIARRVRTAVLGALLVAVGLALVPALPAAAHDELVATDPGADAVVDALPAAITLTFSADLLAEAGAAQVQATDAQGAELVAGDVTVSGSTVTAPLAGSASGTVTVLWRAVSSDGHPVSGQFAFSVAEPPPVETTTAAPTTAPATTEPPSGAATETPVPASSTTASAAESVLPWALLALVLAGGSAVAVVVATRARRRGPGGSAQG